MASASSFPACSDFFQTIMNKLWLGFDLTEAIASPILHVNSKGHVEYEPKFNQVRLRSHLLPETHAAQRLL
jgi:gamma-glutamyltranspeptidase